MTQEHKAWSPELLQFLHLLSNKRLWDEISQTKDITMVHFLRRATSNYSDLLHDRLEREKIRVGILEK
jgi:hypothetical protein